MEPKLEGFEHEVQATEGQQVTLQVTFTGTPKPKITWTFKGTRMEGDNATKLGSDGSLLFVCVEAKHAGRYICRVQCSYWTPCSYYIDLSVIAVDNKGKFRLLN